MAKRPTFEDFKKQFDDDTDDIGDATQMSGRHAVAEALSSMAPMTHKEFMESQENSWRIMSRQTVKAMIRAAMIAPEHAYEIKMLIRFAFRCHALVGVFDLLKADDMDDLEPPESMVDSIYDELIDFTQGEGHNR